MESITPKQKRLIYQSSHRGTKECDLILGPFAAKHVPNMSDDELAAFEKILDELDVDIYAWVTKQKPIPGELKTPMMEALLNFHSN